MTLTSFHPIQVVLIPGTVCEVFLICIAAFSLAFCTVQKTFLPSFYERSELGSHSCPQKALAGGSNADP